MQSRYIHTHPFNGPFSILKVNNDPPNQRWSHNAVVCLHTMQSRVYETVGCPSVCLSICLSICPILRRSRGVRQVCCCGPCRQAISIDCCTARLQQDWSPFDPCPQQSGSLQQMWAVLCLQWCRKLNTDFSFLVHQWTAIEREQFYSSHK